MPEAKRLYRYAERDLLYASGLLHQIKTDSARLDVVHQLQRHLIRCITRTEMRVLRLRQRRKSMAQQGGTRVARDLWLARKAALSALREREEQLLHLLFLWRCFGDGIAFIYQSKYSLKHTYYDEKYNAKATAGFMTEHGRLKRGFAREYRLLCSGIKYGIPVVLCDLTNIIRYGDVCALGAADPVCIEVKSSSNLHARTKKQLKLIEELAKFYANDGAPLFRGLQNVQREATKTQEVDHRAGLNECIETGLRTGWGMVTPELGLTYLAFTAFDGAKLDRLARGPWTVPYLLSAEPDYLPSYPFTLSMNPLNSVAFAQKAFALVVLIDLKELKGAFERRGVKAIMLMNGTHSVQISRSPNEFTGTWRISELMLGRVATEFLSVEWFADEMSRTPDIEPGPPMSLEEAEALPGAVTSLPPEWTDAVDFWELK